MGNVVESCLDHIFIKSSSALIDSAVIKHKISDHYLVAASVQWKQTPNVAHSGEVCESCAAPATTTAQCHRHVLDNRLVREKLLETNFNHLLNIDCPFKLYDELSTLFRDIYNQCYKVKNMTGNRDYRNEKYWINNSLKNMVIVKDRLFKIWCSDPKNMVKRLTYTRYRNKCQKVIFKCNVEHDKKTILDCNNNIKKVWDKINELLGKNKQSLDNLILSNITKQDGTQAVCNEFADTFSKEIDQIKHSCDEKWLERKTYVKLSNVCMRWQPVNGKDIKLIIDKMNKNKSPGSDLIRMSDLKIIVDKISPVLSKLINLSVKYHKFPQKLKEAIIRPVHKRGDRKVFSNYRPIAILSSIDKIMEKCVINQIGTFLQKNNILTECQHGFQKNKSTNTLLSNFTDEINAHLENKKIIVAIFYDFRKAFDTLQTETLLNGMEECGLGQPLNPWFSDYLRARSYRVKVGDAFSEEKQVNCGVPQGSGCGPVCYLMHVNSLCGVLRHCSAHMFADDLCTLSASTDLAEMCRRVQEDVDAVVKWSHDNGIILNADKTKMIIIHSPYLRSIDNPPPLIAHSFDCFHNKKINCTCNPIEKVNCVKYLGVKIDTSFSWDSHIEYLCGKLRILLEKFYYLGIKVPLPILKCLYFALVDSIISYALDCYGLTFKTYIDKIESLQTRFLKLLVNKKTKNQCKGDYSKLYKICKILPASLKHKYLLLVNNHSKQDRLTNLVQHKTGTRSMSKGKFEIPMVQNYYGDRTLKKRVPYLLNSLPEDIRREPILAKFKSLLKKHLLNTL
ncbi:uncharacterized protein LOC119630122 isoform X1 [Bombyx mori]|uniref:Reverse transcriptase domain-containing protein n=1 Tax=Bombyx mori TaxID=7091 RepID=A0A8R2M6B1_BOMMO|nr:uncharacterized protein LOC119630122 isoform X1 [Bombyx mori]